MEKISLGGRFKRVRKDKKLTQQLFATALGISAGFVSEIEQGNKMPGSEVLISLKRVFNVNIDWLLTGEGGVYEKPSIPEAFPTILVPVLGIVPAGFPDHVSEEIVEYIRLPDAPTGSFALVVKGDSMSPNIKDGDYVLFIPNGDIKGGDVVVVNNEWGETMLKRYRIKDGEVILTSDNPEYPSFKPNEHSKIMGKVIKAWRELRF